jgi:Reverse transcriptase (RNA-dependent DNA polymerase)
MDFVSTEERADYIFDKYQALFRKVDNTPLDPDAIESFLGPTILNNPIVRNSKLSQDEAERLDQPLTIVELDNAVNKCRTRSAPGMDGFSNYLIKKIWAYLRYPLFNYAIHCYNTGTLTQNFRSARIKLIPKKGDTSKLNNWRPISLLSNFYKIISRAINTRLNKVVNRICSRAQKGYNSARYAQEVLINVWEQIRYCKNNNIKAAVVAIDMAKAFDTLSHDYLDKVYKFFGFGPSMQRWLSLLGNNREACIALEDGNNSPYFKLETGRPQGDNISPNTFNFGAQILIFKI